MAMETFDRVSSNTFVLPPPDHSQEPSHLSPKTSLETRYLYGSVPFQTTHRVIVLVSIIPFSITSHRGQIFYRAEAFYAPCCQGLGIEELMPIIVSTAQKMYSMHMPYHHWNFNVADVWQQIQAPKEVAHESLPCSEKASLIHNYLLEFLETPSEKEEFPRQVGYLTFPPEKHLWLDKFTERASRPPLAERSNSCTTREADESAIQYSHDQNNQACPVIKLAEEFLNRFRDMKSCSKFSELPIPIQSLEGLDTMRSESATQAFTCCALVASQANEQLKHATFNRFISLCFFLIWEALACESGKAGARVLITAQINAQMKKAGFRGSSRSLKNLRDETAFVNQLVASVDSIHGTGVASLVFYHIFSSSNYHLVRRMNRYSTARKRLAIRAICEHLDVVETRRTSLPTLRIQDILKELMPSLHDGLINSSIGYVEVGTVVAVEEDSDFP
ncbi:hypothetical protein GMOD_00009657 [Pyrenophora seminiperda CCB06]|uniref:Uncharacterized protein n=1 Tax=Pyrenophora seminiperda CCB06 TaxID=1302712 RepID=A0A3M7MFI2_9PLEO|nr:hypothetical protein GMOD_00009657 [Pyrenophora seminiperda CCB06]